MEEVEKTYINMMSQGIIECEIINEFVDTCQTEIKYGNKYRVVDSHSIIKENQYNEIMEEIYLIELNYFKEFIKSRNVNKDMVVRFIKDLTSQE